MRTLDSSNLDEIKKLYFEENQSATLIAARFQVIPDVVYSFMHKNNLRCRTLAEDNSIRFSRKQLSFSLKTNLTREEESLKVAGIMLYWGEGYQTTKAHGVDFANSNPTMIAVFIKFLREVCGVKEEKLRGYIYCYSNQDPSVLIKFWSDLTLIPPAQIMKPYVRKDFKENQIDKMKHGTFHVRYYDKKLLSVILEWIKEYAGRLAPIT